MINTLRKMALMLTIALATIMPAVMNAENNSKIKAPDFKYPETVASDANNNLEKALKAHDGNAVVTAVVQIGLASTMISERAAAVVTSRIDSIVTAPKSALAPDHKALLWMVKGMIWKSMDGGRYDFDGDAKQKARDAFSRSIDPEGNGNAECLMRPLSDYPGIIAEGNALGNRSVPTLYDFIAMQYLWVLQDDEEAQERFVAQWMQKHRDDTDIMPRLFIDSRSLLGMPNVPYCYEREAEAHKLYERYADHEESALLLNLFGYESDSYDTVCRYIERFPDSEMCYGIRAIKAEHEAKEVSVRCRKTLQTTDPIVATVEMTNVNECTLTLYQVPDHVMEPDVQGVEPSMLDEVESIRVTAEGTIPFVAKDVKATFRPRGFGRYVVLASYDTPKGKQQNKLLSGYELENSTFVVSDLRSFHVGNRIFAVDSHDGRPSEDAIITYSSTRNESSTGATNADGYVIVPEQHRYVRATVRKADDRYLPETSYSLTDYKPTVRHSISMQPDLCIYRPGETARISLIAFELAVASRKVMNGVLVNLTLKDTAGNPVESRQVTTDAFGQATCEFQIPTDRMNGTFSIFAWSDDEAPFRPSYCRFEVSEYKTPTFYVDLDETSATQPADGKALIKGRVKTYSGLPVANALVECTLEPQLWWFWRDDTMLEEQAFEVMTDSQGCFEFECPKEWTSTETENALPSWKRAFYVFALTAEVTNAAGETHSASKTFSMGRSRYISVPSELVCRLTPNATTLLNIAYHSTDLTDISADCHYTLSDTEGKTVVAEGKFNTSRPEVDWRHIASGCYMLTIGIDGEPAEKAFKAQTVIYRETDKESPLDTAFWLPEASQSVTTDGKKARMLIATGTTDSFIYYIASSRNGITSQGWLHYHAGMHWLELPMPSGRNEMLSVRFLSVHDGKNISQDANFTSPIVDKVKISAVTFRNRITPGTHEHWTFSLTDANGKPVEGRMAFELYNQALHNLSANVWNIDNALSSIDINASLQWYHGNANIFAPRYVDYPERKASDGNQLALNIPYLQLYGHYFMQRQTNFVLKLSDSSHAPVGMAMPESANVEMAVGAQSAALMDNAAGIDIAAETGNGSNNEFDNITLRTDEVKVALWLPQLTSDANGNISIEFDVPDYNTSWRLQALAFDKTLATDIMHDKVLAQRPLMVQPSLPRFLRAGDVTRLAANVMNASDATLGVRVLIETFDPRNDQVILTETRNIEIAPESTEAVFIDCKAPLDAPYIGFRIRAIGADGNGDGEQQMLPVLTDQTPVTETLPFYQHPGDNNLVLQVANNASSIQSEGDRLVFEFCNNPVWYCITALPTIANTENATSTGVAHSLYAMALASKFASDNPAVLDAIHQWKAMAESGNDNPLTSQLAVNADLKITSLLASPWLPEAERQNLRMSLLHQLFSDAQSQASIGQLISKLSSFQRADGGFAWIDDSSYPLSDHSSSYWATAQVLELVGELWHLGCITDNAQIRSMMQSAIRYFDHETLRLEDEMLKAGSSTGKRTFSFRNVLRRNARPSYMRFQGYLYVRTLFDGIEAEASVSKRIGELKKNTLSSIEEEWGNTSIPEKAYCAIILHRNQRSQQARRVTESIRQFAVKDPHRGMYWERIERSSWQHPVACTSVVLQALAEVDGRQEEIDMIRQWMLLEKQTSDWGGSSLAADAVYSLLTTGTEWLHPGKQQASALPDNGVTLIADGKGIELPATDTHLGYFRIDLPADTRHIEVTRTGHNPAWGSLYHQYVGRMAEVKAASVPEVSIQKQIIISGNHAEVQLTVICDKALEYVTIRDERPAFLEPDDQLSGFHWGKEFYYLETKDSETRLFCTRLSEGRHVFTYRCSVTNAGTFTSGIATVQSQYAPQFTAHSEGEVITIGTGNH